MRGQGCEVIFLANVGLASHNIKHNIPNNVANHNQFIPSEHLKTQEYVQKINNWTEENKMRLKKNMSRKVNTDAVAKSSKPNAESLELGSVKRKIPLTRNRATPAVDSHS